MKVRAYGKLNLTLKVTGRRENLHTLGSVMTTVSVYDELEAEESDIVKVSCEGVPEETNIAYRAAKLVEGASGLKMRLTIKKGIAVGGGMGGSSADGAAVLAMANRILESRGQSLDIKALAPKLGSDVYFMTQGGACFVGGTGDELAPFESKTDFTALVIDCGEVSTPACYKAFDEIGITEKADPCAVIELLERGETLTDGLLFNDLMSAAKSLNPRIEQAEKLLAKEGIKAHLTGSGGCIFALTSDNKISSLLNSHGYKSYFVHYVPHGVEFI